MCSALLSCLLNSHLISSRLLPLTFSDALGVAPVFSGYSFQPRKLGAVLGKTRQAFVLFCYVKLCDVMLCFGLRVCPWTMPEFVPQPTLHGSSVYQVRRHPNCFRGCTRAIPQGTGGHGAYTWQCWKGLVGSKFWNSTSCMNKTCKNSHMSCFPHAPQVHHLRILLGSNLCFGKTG